MVRDEIFSARDRFSGALQFAADKVEEVQTRSLVKNPVKPRSHRAMSSSRRRRRKGRDSKSGFHHTFVMKLFDRSVDLAQFSENTSLYPVCRAWMKNQPLNKEMAPRIRTPTPEPPLSERSEEILYVTHEEMGLSADSDGETRNGRSREALFRRHFKPKVVFKLPAFIPLQKDVHDNDFISPRIPDPSVSDFDDSFDINKDQNAGAPSPALLLSDHMVRWCQVRKRWKESALKNESRFEASAILLGNMFEK